MILLPPHLLKQYRSICADHGISDNEFVEHLKWLRYFLDFCEKYQISGDEAERIGLFLDKLRQKGQSEEKRQQAKQAVSRYFDMIRGGVKRQATIQNLSTAQVEHRQSDEDGTSQPYNSFRNSFYNIAGYQEKSDSPEWDEVMEKLAAEIKVRHYSRKTLQTLNLD